MQGFPESFHLPGEGEGEGASGRGGKTQNKNEHRAYHQVGNAVAPPVIAAIARCIIATGVFS
jgi:site-specific DNA-cytosine methylase